AKVAAGRGNSVLIEGEPGIGKSALVRAALARAADRGCAAFWGAGDELGQALPLRPLLDGLRVFERPADPRRNMIVRLLRGEAGAGGGGGVWAARGGRWRGPVAGRWAAARATLVWAVLGGGDGASAPLGGGGAGWGGQRPLLGVGTGRRVPRGAALLSLRGT